ncbi:MAG: DUF3179 domain-containing protein [Candidatus Marinimicrobia bacterium]|nr:DUF3179 domain-containing protein [Candidatus Neomarinimicrobiota bacterium]
MRRFILLTLLASWFFNASCEKVELISDSGGDRSADNYFGGSGGIGDWLVPESEVLKGAGKDAIPALTDPELVRFGEVNYLNGADLVIGLMVDGEPRAYPHRILDWHEIINDRIGSTYFAITYCPLTGSGIVWDQRQLTNASFGVSGLLYNSNLIPYDRSTNSYWSQMKLMCVFGERLGEIAPLLPIVETTWNSWRAMYPDTKVVSNNTGHERPYQYYPYGTYRSTDFLMFPVKPLDRRLPLKERVTGVIVDNAAKVYRLSSFKGGLRVINDTFRGVPLIVAGSETQNMLLIFGRSMPDGTVLTFEPVQDQLPIIMQDNEGTLWDVFGWGIVGPRVGQRLPVTNSFIAYWFAWGAFYPDPVIYTE